MSQQQQQNQEPALVLQQLQEKFQTRKTRPIAYRKQQIRNLLKGYIELEKQFYDALKQDLGLDDFNSFLYQYNLTKLEIEETLDSVDKWALSRPIDTTVLAGPGKTFIKPEPYGVVLVMSAWNYPLFTAIPGFCQALAAGNCVIVKPSELAANSAKVIRILIEKYMDQDCYKCIEGDHIISAKLTTLKFDLIMFTGSPEKGKLVAKAAAENLVPCLLELGGKNPTIVDDDANLESAALRIIQGRFINCGQTCIASDYVLVHENVKKNLLLKFQQKILEFYGQNPQKSSDYSRILTVQHTERLVSMLNVENHKGVIVCGGQYDIQNKYIAPTVIEQPTINSKVMTEEIFGPILPVLSFKDINQVISFINQREKPLALYYFGNKNQNLINDSTSSGTFVVNEVLFQLSNPYLPFGGVGYSGQGKYRSITGFDAFSHLKPVFVKANFNFFPYSQRYPPYSLSKQRILRMMFSVTNIRQSKLGKSILGICAAILITKFGYQSSIYQQINNRFRKFVNL